MTRPLTRQGRAPRAALGAPQVLRTLDELETIAPEWDELALLARSPFLTVEWLTSWWSVLGTAEPLVLVQRDEAGRLAGAAFCRRTPQRLEAAANLWSGNWDVLARDEAARRELWHALAQHAPGRLRLVGLIEEAPETQVARESLRAAGYSLSRRGGVGCPFLVLPDGWETLIGGVSRNLRSQVARRGRALERLGTVRFRTVTGGDELPSALGHVLRLEGSGWKAREGTAILSDPALEALYRSFAARAAERGWLRLHLLELDDEPIAADFGIAFGSTGFLMKTGFDERYGELSPGLVLRARALRASIEEGLRAYDFLGRAEPYKLRWGAHPRPRFVLLAYRGAATLPERVFERAVRPAAKRVALATVLRNRARRGASPPSASSEP
ncbi:MAG: GNAT family N-acetyltransferase [Actinomycetota bacterium]|nr:GNAT family N-acetyltransferase [Actinomycetota bacterium]